MNISKKLPYINIGCGNKFHTDWVNIDMNSNHPDIISHNILDGLPFDDHSFDVVYHSQVLEHFPKDKACGFIKECHRILKKGGIIRIVVPDLENIIDEYKRLLEKNLNNPTAESEANYEWIMLELFDQSVREGPGGMMLKYLQKKELANEKYVFDRIGFIAKLIRKQKNCIEKNDYVPSKVLFSFSMIKKILKKCIKMVSIKKGYRTEEYKLGKFRLSGEIHKWMYDRYSLSKLLLGAGFADIKVLDPYNSCIPDWDKYELDVKNGTVYDPCSLFVEAVK